MNSIPSCFVISFPLLLLILHASPVVAKRPTTPRFRDVSRSAGILQKFTSLKYGGPAIADLDGDGHPDFILGHHDSAKVELYRNNGNGTFTKSPWGVWFDTHGITPYRHLPGDRGLRFSISRGGVGNYPHIFAVDPDTFNVRDVSNYAGMRKARGRGRAAVYFHASPRNFGAMDVLFSNNFMSPTSRHQVLMRGKPDYTFSRSRLRKLERDQNKFLAVADVDGDERVEILTMHDLRAYKVTGPMQLRDISSSVFPSDMLRYGVVAVAELDFNNDGVMDLYVARSGASNLAYLNAQGNTPLHDVLLLGRANGKGFVDVTKKSGIPNMVDVRGVTAADFNNDGNVDVIISRHDKPDMLLLNDGSGRFLRAVRAPWWRNPSRAAGDLATAVDYDGDGRVDVLSAQGHHLERRRGGYFRLYRNQLGGPLRGRFLLVRVGSSPDGRASSMYARVVAVRHDGRKMTRRVGSPGTSVCVSYIETVHFGLGRAKNVRKVVVHWENGESRTRWGLKAGSKTVFGKIP